jgi:hypothetical protein
MQNVADIFGLWPSDAEVARDIGVSYPTVSSWKQRGSIPAAYWRRVIRAAARRGYSKVTAELLVEVHAQDRAAFRGLAEEGTRYETDEERRDGEQASGPSGHFSRYKHLRRGDFKSADEIEDHIRALREEWSPR